MSEERGNAAETRRLLARGREESPDDAGTVAAYEDAAGVPRATPGDGDAPWGKSPPFPSQVRFWHTEDGVSTSDYVFTPGLNVDKRHGILVWVRYTALGAPASGGLSLIPQVRNDDDTGDFEWFNTTVIDPTIALIDPPGAAFDASFGSRNFYPAELRTAINADQVVQSHVLPFDVRPYREFRLAYAGLQDSVNVVFGYSFWEA